MNAAESIVQEVSCSADLRNGEVIERAFVGRKRCPHCNYPDNWAEYELLLGQYERAKVKLHHAKRDIRKAWSRVLGNGIRNVTVHSEFEYEVLLRETVRIIKAQMKPIRPCWFCKLEYNPTHKPSLDFYRRPKLRPPIKEFLDV